MELIGQKIRSIRKSKGISQTAVAASCGIKQSSYANIENGKTQNITIEIGKGIAKSLSISFNELFDIEYVNSDVDALKSEMDELLKSLKEKNERIEEKDLLIGSLERENIKFRGSELRSLLDGIFEEAYEGELKIEGMLSEKDRKRQLATISANEREARYYIESGLREGIISVNTVMGVITGINGIVQSIEKKAETKDAFIVDFCDYIRRYMEIDQLQVELFVCKKLILKWDTKKIEQQKIKLDRLLNL